MSDLHWYVACVRSCQERNVASHLAARGVETYVPVQKIRRQWSDRVRIIDKPVIPGLVFIRSSEETRASVFGMVSGIVRFLTDRAGYGGRVLVVPERQMEDFMHVVRILNGEEDISIVTSHIEKGDMVRVMRGPLAGFVCECAEVYNRHNLIIRLGLLGSVLITVDAADVVKV